MGKKKKRERKTSVFASVEGKREKAFLLALKEIYQLKENNIKLNIEYSSGGTPDKIISTAIKTSYGMRVFAWLDEDFEPEYPLSREIRKRLLTCWNIKEPDATFFECPFPDLQSKYNQDGKKPVIVTSRPVCVESIILQILDKNLPFKEYDPEKRRTQIDTLKGKLKEQMENKSEEAFYIENLSKEKLEAKRKEIPELDLILSLISKKHTH